MAGYWQGLIISATRLAPCQCSPPSDTHPFLAWVGRWPLAATATQPYDNGHRERQAQPDGGLKAFLRAALVRPHTNPPTGGDLRALVILPPATAQHWGPSGGRTTGGGPMSLTRLFQIIPNSQGRFAPLACPGRGPFHLPLIYWR